MRYFKSLLFDAGLVLILAGITSFSTKGETHIASSTPQDWFQASYTDYDMRFPLGLTVAGLAVASIAVLRPKSD